MTQPTPQVLQAYTLLQIAAEAFLGRDRNAQQADPFVRRFDKETLMLGNGHSSRMTEKQAEQFAREWRVVAHQPNTATGFSGTLFEYIGDPNKQLTSSKYVVSFRSTEFIEDAARDGQATNTEEIKAKGWAFGQIADMETWWNSVKAEVVGGQVDVTGYSLGGHLATAFYELHGSALIDHVYTFNGAGVGKVNAGTLADALAVFNSHKAQGSNASLFTDPEVRAQYLSLQEIFSAGKPASGAQAVAALNALHVLKASYLRTGGAPGSGLSSKSC